MSYVKFILYISSIIKENMKVHLYNDLKISKATVLRIVKESIDNFNSVDELMLDNPEIFVVKELLERRGQSYTIQEALMILPYYITSHDECVYDNEEDFSSIEVYTVSQKIKRFDAAKTALDSLK